MGERAGTASAPADQPLSAPPRPGGSTAGGEGIKLAYKVAGENFIKNGNNRIILATDGDFNVGASSDSDMQQLIEEKRNFSANKSFLFKNKIIVCDFDISELMEEVLKGNKKLENEHRYGVGIYKLTKEQFKYLRKLKEF